MGYTINYSELEEMHGKETADKIALDDALEYLGHKRYKILARAMRSGKYSYQQLCFFAGIAGLEGYPVNVMYFCYAS